MFVIELAVPFLFFLPPPFCYAAALLTIGLMLLIMATGNYCFFNLLTIALCLLVFDDAIWVHIFPKPTSTASVSPWWTIPPLAFLMLLSLGPMSHLFNRRIRIPVLESALDWLQPFHLVNGYGLFAVMTTTRPEIVIEGSSDGVGWKPYEFKWKPGNPTRRLRYCMPHQPRLDWQMWFAALGDFRPWFINLMIRLLEGSSDVLFLLRENPFAVKPPRYIRATVYRYRFTDLSLWRGAWWIRERAGLYFPILTLNGTRDLDRAA
jgi:hypothetical protein